jgi:hypothetical protein
VVVGGEWWDGGSPLKRQLLVQRTTTKQVDSNTGRNISASHPSTLSRYRSIGLLSTHCFGIALAFGVASTQLSSSSSQQPPQPQPQPPKYY